MDAGGHGERDGAAPLPLLAALLAVTAFALGLRLVDLDYNGPFIDESFHAVVAEYGNVPHLTGEVWLYPQLSRAVHAHYGLLGARALSAVFGALTVACVFGLAAVCARHLVEPQRVAFTAAAAALLFAVAAPPVFVSRFANYYALAFGLFAFGCCATLRGLDRGSRASLAVGAVAFVASFATRYLLLGFLPIALWAVLARTRTASVRVSRAAFWIPFAVAFGIYAFARHEHILEALRHAQWSGTALPHAPADGVRWLVLREALGRTAPVTILAALGLAVHAKRAFRGGAEADRLRRFDLLWLAVGAVWMAAYHVAFAHDLTLESNLTLSMIFAAVLGGLGVDWLAGAQARSVTPRAWLVLAASVALTAWHARPIVAEDQTWPDWRPVVAAAERRGAGEAAAVWSTADNGGMRNTWGVREATGRMSGNVWHLRQALGPAVDVSSPWRHPRTDELLGAARAAGVEFVIGPIPLRNLTAGRRVAGYLVTDVIDVPYGPAVYILRRVADPDPRAAPEGT